MTARRTGLCSGGQPVPSRTSVLRSESAVSWFPPHKLQLPVQRTARVPPGSRLDHEHCCPVTRMPQGRGFLRPETAVWGGDHPGASAPAHTWVLGLGVPSVGSTQHSTGAPHHPTRALCHHARPLSLQPYPHGILVLLFVFRRLGFRMFPGELEHPAYWGSHIPLGKSVSVPRPLAARGGLCTQLVIWGLWSCRHSLL